MLVSQRVCLSPTAASLLMTIESIHGLKATASLERFEARSIGKEGEPNNWLHAFQPSWSLDGLYVYHRQIRHRQFFAVHEVPLTAITPCTHGTPRRLCRRLEERTHESKRVWRATHRRRRAIRLGLRCSRTSRVGVRPFAGSADLSHSVGVGP